MATAGLGADQATEGAGQVISVVICDDVDALRRLYRRWFEQEPDIELVGEATNGAEVLALTDELHPDVVLLDLNMPGMDGLDALKHMSASHPETKVLVFTGFAKGPLDRTAKELGAIDFIEKGTPLDEVTARIRSAVAG